MKDREEIDKPPLMDVLLTTGRGRLRIYLGWAPGLGKTRRAVLACRALRDRGVDLVIGWLEEKSREEIVEVARGIERVAPLAVTRGGASLSEIDLMGILKRNPATVLIDELAHENAPGMTNRKRWEDVETLLDAGISVISTLNAYHISELSGAASLIMNAPVREIVPVEFVKRADEIVVVDLSPDLLIQRIAAGQVFPPDQTGAALNGLFQTGPLTRLREMTLAFAAKVLDHELVRRGGKKGVYERVLVLVSDRPAPFDALIGYAGEFARRSGGELLVLHLRKKRWWGGDDPIGEEALSSLKERAGVSGGALSVLWSRNFPWTVWRFVKRTKSTCLVLGHSGKFGPWRSSLVRLVLRYFPKIDVEVHLIPTGVVPPYSSPSSDPEKEPPSLPRIRGRLTLYLGAAPGIGKTYRMLQDGQELLKKGVDLVVGYLETHGRPQTEKISEGLPRIPRKALSYGGLYLEEMDLPAILARDPSIVLVDELAHTNPEGFKNRKRYQDVSDLLEAGFDVFSTLNIQHIESLNDLIEMQTGIRVRETVPDSVVSQAFRVVLVDLTPEELQERLIEGNVYAPEKVDLALRNFFTKKNLTALRELAMMRVGGNRASQFLWNTGREILLAGVSDRRADAALIRRGAVLAERFRLSLRLLYVHPPGGQRTCIPELRELARSFGATMIEHEQAIWTEDWIATCREMTPRLTLLGQSAWRPGFESTAEKIARQFTEFPMIIVPLDIREHLLSRVLPGRKEADGSRRD